MTELTAQQLADLEAAAAMDARLLQGLDEEDLIYLNHEDNDERS